MAALVFAATKLVGRQRLCTYSQFKICLLVDFLPTQEQGRFSFEQCPCMFFSVIFSLGSEKVYSAKIA